jgi:hypothetical protein
VAPQQNPGALYGWLIAQHFEDKKALEYGNQYFKKNGKISPVYDDPVWLALPIKKHDLEYEKTAYNLFEVKEFGQQMVYIKSSRPHQKPLKIWLYNTPYLSHTSYSQNHFELWQGPDDLFIRGGNYLGSPSVYKRYFSSSFARNTIAFVPKNTSQPDLKGGQNLKDVNYRLDTTFYPDAVRLNSYRMHRYRGHFNFSEVDTVKKYGIFCGDASVVYPQADYYSRDFIFIYPGLLIINDRFEMKDHQNIEKIRWIFHSRHIPKIEESWITKEGNIEEGIHHANQIEEVVLQQNNSQVKIRTLQNSANKLITQGGGKYSSYMDDRFYIPERDCQNWMKGTKHLINRKMYIADQYTSWFEYDMTQQIKHLAFLLTIDDMSTNTVQILKTYSDSSHKFLTVKYLGQTIKIGLPRNNKSNPYVKFL